MGETGQQGGDQQEKVGLAVVSVLISISISTLFSVYGLSGEWWLAVVLAVAVPSAIGGAIKVGGDRGILRRIGRWLLR